MKPLILLTGASGYIGGRLPKRFENENLPVRCLMRRPRSFQGRASSGTELVAGDVLDSGSLESAMDGVHLVHSMEARRGLKKQTVKRRNALPLPFSRSRNPNHQDNSR